MRSLLAGGVVAVVAVLSTLADADALRFPRATVAPQVKLSARVRPSVPAAASSTSKASIEVDSILSIPDLQGPIRSEQEEVLAKLIQNTPDHEVEEKSDYYFRLGTMYAKQHRYWRDQAAKDPTTPNQTAAQKAKDYLLKTVKTYKGLVENDAFRAYPKLDIALFYFGYTLQSGKYMKEARAVYDKLLKNHPNSKYVPEAHLAFAEYYFEAGQLADAEARYKQVLKFPKSSAYWYAMYKMGWIHLNLQRHQDALETFFQVALATKTDAKQAALSRAAKHDFVVAYAGIGKADKAFAAFQRLDTALAREMVEDLAKIYADTGKLDQAVYMYRELVKLEPANANVCEWEYQVAHALLTAPSATTAEKVREIENLAKLWKALEGKATLPQDRAEACRADAAAMSGELARAYHSEAFKTRNPETIAYAVKLYVAYLDAFPAATDRDDMQFFLGEALWTEAEGVQNVRLRNELLEHAADVYAGVATSAQSPGRKRDAAIAGVLAWRNILDVAVPAARDIDLAAAATAAAPQPKALAAREQKLLSTIDAATAFASDPDLELAIATLLRRSQQFDKAMPVLIDLVEHHHTHASAEAAALMLLEAMVRLQRYDEVLQLADKLRADAKFMTGKPDLEKGITFLRSRSLRRR